MCIMAITTIVIIAIITIIVLVIIYFCSYRLTKAVYGVGDWV